nr:hypothetical protein [Tanacetum cinerariifolium]
MVPVWVKMHKVPVVAYSEDGLSLIGTQIGKPIMLDTFTSSMCVDPWGRLRYACALIEVSAKKPLKHEVIMAYLEEDGSGHTLETIRVEYEWKPLLCIDFHVFRHLQEQCPNHVKEQPSSSKQPKTTHANSKNQFDALEDQIEDMDGFEGISANVNETVDNTLINEEEDSEVEELNINDTSTKGESTPLNIGNAPSVRCHLWSELDVHKHVVHKSPCVLLGDFNVSLNMEDVSTGSSSINVAMNDFNDCVANIKVLDVNYSRLLYTWNQKPKGRHGILKKLDRIMDEVQKDLEKHPDDIYLRGEEAVYVQEFSDAKLDEDRFLNIKNDLNSSGVEVTGRTVPEVFVTDASNDFIVHDISNDEIKAAMFDIGDDWAPGPDGFHPMMIKWIMACVTSTSFSLSINGDIHRYFKVALPSPDYVPVPEEPQIPPAPHDEDEHEPMFIQPHYPDFVPERIYPEYIPLEDEYILPDEEQPLPHVVSPTVESPEYVAESDQEEDQEEYKDDEAEDGPEEEEHLALADSAVVMPTDELVSPPEGTEPVMPPPFTDTATTGARITVRLQAAIPFPPEAKVERLLAMPTPSPSPFTSLSPPTLLSPTSARERLARCTTPAALPSPPLHMPPPVDHWDDIPETKMPPRKRLCLSTLGSKYEARESSTARPTRGRGIDYGFVSTLDVEARRRGIGEVGYDIRDTWVDPTETVLGIAPMTAKEVNTRVTELHEHDTQDLYALLEDAQDSRTRISQQVVVDSQRVDLLMKVRIAHQETKQIVEEKAYAAREAWAHSIGLSQAVYSELQTHQEHMYAYEFQLQTHQT